MVLTLEWLIHFLCPVVSKYGGNDLVFELSASFDLKLYRKRRRTLLFKSAPNSNETLRSKRPAHTMHKCIQPYQPWHSKLRAWLRAVI